ncbi:hypothetical protein TNIN_456441 [Trichonephila inaurata madagascariensis]|uniref:Uncharacterized protein n=1 Tax=Trichonephila inaurata madagascariensis TaxID=2747483 RepID=A0A8X6XBY1_9ARAC|nr:hypothetical protein TNIN_456441 [Trichonephila inaurata madagascariensis]
MGPHKKIPIFLVQNHKKLRRAKEIIKDLLSKTQNQNSTVGFLPGSSSEKRLLKRLLAFVNATDEAQPYTVERIKAPKKGKIHQTKSDMRLWVL